MSNFILQLLERRTHLSASPSVADHACPEVTEAQGNLQETVVQYRQDKRELARDLAEIRADIREEIVRLKADDADGYYAIIKPLQQAMAEAVKAHHAAVKEARDAITELRDEWAPIIAADTQAFIDAKRSGDADAEAEARAKLEADRNQLKTDLKPLKDALEAVYADGREAVEAARKDIYDAYADMSPTLSDLLDQLKETAQSGRDKMIANHNAVVAAQSQLKDALIACRDDHA